MRILGIETSCDETAAALVEGTPGGKGRTLSNIVLSQLKEHAPYGGVVPEIAARAHVEALDRIIDEAMRKADITWNAIDAIAATAGPGLVGGVMVGLMTAKGLCVATGKPLIAVNHLEGHALSPRLVLDCPFPYLLLLVSGGHTQLLAVEGLGRYRLMGTTIDDAVGEAFDKTAKLLGLGFPGGPAVERAARNGDASRFRLPRPLIDREGFDFSFSGLKTAVRNHVGEDEAWPREARADMAASFQQAVIDVLSARAGKAMDDFARRKGAAAGLRFVIAGGVAANAGIRASLEKAAGERGFTLLAPPPALCTDNGAMIAWAGLERFAMHGADDLIVAARARWPLAS
ncbi:MAG: tRNA (adenosine(37)-N6)-threonylcarbamoyltransferase complex transferase subunit TsaD [Alphaproteobacteria bacterium]|nr:tRNA (adenosine(37)-N6)-threonylcarbamoyltransferase complex transferase subunit TsaD [Alphaproteobacteria bacterium]